MGALDNQLAQYRSIVERILTQIAAYSQKDECQDQTLFDRDADRYAVISRGWKKERLLHHVLIYLELLNGKIWVQADNTDLVVARELEKAGIPKSDIVLGFHPPRLRPLTEYAVA